MKQEEHEDTSKFSSHFGFPLQREFCAFWNTLSSKGSRTSCTTYQCRCQGTATLYEQNGPNKHSPKEAIQYSHISIHIFAYIYNINILISNICYIHSHVACVKHCQTMCQNLDEAMLGWFSISNLKAINARQWSYDINMAPHVIIVSHSGDHGPSWWGDFLHLRGDRAGWPSGCNG